MLTMIHLFLIIVVLIGLLTAFVLTLLKKFGVIEWLQVHGNEFVHKLANCDFCLSFWISGIFAILLVIITGVPMLLAIPLFSTMITRNLL